MSQSYATDTVVLYKRSDPPSSLIIHAFRTTADSRMDASSEAFSKTFCEEERHADWIVTSPPYNEPPMHCLARVDGLPRGSGLQAKAIVSGAYAE